MAKPAPAGGLPRRPGAARLTQIAYFRARRAPDGTLSVTPEAVRVWLLDGFRVSGGSRTIQKSGWRLRKAATLIKLLAGMTAT